MFLLLLLLFILLLFHTAARMRCSCTEAFTLVLIHSSFHAALFWHFCSHGTTTALLLLHISPTIALSLCFHTVILLMHAALTLLLFHCCFCTAAHIISTTSAEFAADPVCRAVSGAISEDEELANDLERCAAVCKDFKVDNLTFSQLTGCTEGLLCSQSRQQRAAQNALDDSLDPKEREAWEIVSRVTWGNLLPESGGIEISDTALRAISLEQLHQIVMHVTSRIEGGEQWIVGRFPHGQYVEHQITKVDEVITETTHMMIAELVSQVNLYDADKYLIRPATVDSRRSFVEACCSCLAWAFLSHLCDADNGCCLAVPRFLLFALVCSLPMPTAKFQDYLVGGPRVFPNSSYV
jgi:hypothetical protein